MTVIGIGLLPTVCKQTEALRRSVQEESEQRVRERAEEPSKIAAAVLQPEVAERKRTEEALHESEERCQNLFKNAVDAIMTFTPDGTITSVNHRLEMTLGWSREELISCHYSKLVTPASVAAVEERIRQFLAGERSASIFAADLVRKDRSVVPVEAHICPIRDQAGALIEILGIYQDLTERKRAEEESRRSIAELAEWRNRYEAAIQATGQVLYDWNSQTDEVIWGGAVEQMLGYTLGELPGTLAAAMALIHSEDRAIFVQEIERVRAIKTALQLEYRLRRKDGAYITVENKGHFFVDRTGVPVRMVGFLADITEHQQRAKALRKSEEQLRAQYRGIPIPTYTWQRVGDDFVLIDYNDAAHAITRGRIGELIGVKASECHRNAPGSRAEFLRCWREKTIIKREMQWRFSDGEIKYFAVSYAFVPPDLVLVHTEDITERKRAEAALQQSEERFSKAFHASPDPITISTLADGRFLDVNARFLEMLGYQREEVISHSALELGLWTNPADHASVTAVLHEQGSIRNREATFRTKAGERRKILLAVELMTLNGEPCVLALIHDITARKQMDIALRESEERYRALFENANDAIATATLEGIFTQVNRAAECLLGLSREEVIGQPVQKFLTPTSAAYKADRIRRALAGEQLSATFELEVVNKNGKVIPVEARARLIRNPEGHPIGYQGIYRDITERKALEQQRADFLAMLSHDIRNPL